MRPTEAVEVYLKKNKEKTLGKHIWFYSLTFKAENQVFFKIKWIYDEPQHLETHKTGIMAINLHRSSRVGYGNFLLCDITTVVHE